jgi:hypothetical protein
MFTMKSKVVSWRSVVNGDFVQSDKQKVVMDITSQFQNFCVSFHKCHTLFCMRLSQSRLSQVLCKLGFKSAHGCTQNMENDFVFDFFRVLPQRCQRISESHQTSNR